MIYSLGVLEEQDIVKKSLRHPPQTKEMTQTEHRGGENFKKNHPNTGQQPSQIDRNQANQARRKHWKQKANEQQ
jgi:hypothetical protein